LYESTHTEEYEANMNFLTSNFLQASSTFIVPIMLTLATSDGRSKEYVISANAPRCTAASTPLIAFITESWSLISLLFATSNCLTLSPLSSSALDMCLPIKPKLPVTRISNVLDQLLVHHINTLALL